MFDQLEHVAEYIGGKEFLEDKTSEVLLNKLGKIPTSVECRHFLNIMACSKGMDKWFEIRWEKDPVLEVRFQKTSNSLSMIVKEV